MSLVPSPIIGVGIGIIFSITASTDPGFGVDNLLLEGALADNLLLEGPTAEDVLMLE